MIADYFTKPLQGTLFRKFRDFIMNVDPLPTMTRVEERRSVLEHERDPRHDSVGLTQDSPDSLGMTEEQTARSWTAVSHGKRKYHRHKILRKKIMWAGKMNGRGGRENEES